MSSETLTASNGIQAQEAEEAEKVGVGAYISLFFAMCFFSGVFYKMPDAYRWLGAFDFTTFCLKFVGGVFVRFCLKTFYKKDFQNA